MTDFSEVRRRAWETRRLKYGPKGHNGRYWRGATPKGMLDLIIKLHVDGVLSEGQVAQATGISRVQIRILADRT